MVSLGNLLGKVELFPGMNFTLCKQCDLELSVYWTYYLTDSQLYINKLRRRECMKKDLKLYWKKNLSLMVVLLSIWAIVSYGFGILFVDQMNAIKIAGFPLGFWFAQQGSIYVFVVLIFIYYFIMKKVDEEFDVHE